MNSEVHSEAQRQRSSLAYRLAWLPVPLFLAAIAILFSLDLGRSYERPHLLVALNLVCSALPSLFVAYLCARSFLARGAPGLLLLGCGVLLWAASGVVGIAAGLVKLSGPNSANVAITIFNSCVWLSALSQLAGAVLLVRPRRRMREPGLWLSSACAIALGLLGLLTLAALAHWMPTFFVQGQGGTPLRQFVLGSGIAMFVLTSVLLWLTADRSASSFAYWYSLALALIAVGLLAVMGQSVQGGILGWTGRAAQFLGSAYMLVAAIASARESRAWGIPLEEALSEAREQYRALVELSPDAVAVHADAKWVYVNPAAVRLFGATRADQIVGREARDLVHPEDREAVTARVLLIEQEGQTAPVSAFKARRLDGQPVDVESSAIQIKFQGRPAVLVVLRDITARKRAENALKESEAKYRNLFENMTEEVHFWQLVRDDEGRIKTWKLVDANPPTLKTWGRALDEIKGKTTDEIFGLGATEHYMPVVRKIMTDGVPYVFEDYFPNLGKYFRYASVPLGEYFITTGADITRHKQAEDELRKSSAELQAANMSLHDSRRAALNMMEDALAARQRAERASAELRQEIAERQRAEEEVRTLARYPAENPNPVLRLDSAGRVLFANAASAPVLDQWGTTVGGHAPEPWPDTARNALANRVSTNVELRCEDRAYDVFVVGVPNAAYVNLYTSDITDRVRVEQELARTKIQLETLLATAPIGFCYLDRNLRFLMINERLAAINGASVADTLGKTVAEIVPSLLPTIQEVTARILATGQGVIGHEFSGETPLQPGVTRYWSESWYPVRDEAGAIIGFGVIVEEITARKQADEALRESEEKYRNLFANMAEEVHFWQLVRDEAGHIKTWRLVDANPPTLKTWGRASIDEIRGKTTDEIFGGGATEHYMPVVQKIMTEGVPYSFEDYFAQLDKYFRFTSVPLGEHFITTGADITSLKKAELDLRQSREDLTRAQAVAHIGSWRLNVRRNELSWSDENWRIFGVPTGTPLTYETFLGTIHPEDRDYVHKKWSAALQGAPYDIEHRIVVGDTVKWVRERAELEFDQDGTLLGGFGTTQDITQRKEVEELIKASLREKEVLLKEIHHRVKNNLQVISSLVRLQADGLDDHRLRDLFRDVHDRVQSMALVHERLYQSESLAQVDFGEYARSLLSHLWRSQGADAARIQLRLDLDRVSLSVETAVPCGLILNELASNALKHAFAGRAAGGVTVSLHAGRDGRVRLCVCDDGVGLPEGLDWRQVRSLGLRLVQMLATQINGAVEMRSGAGTEFAITFTPPGAPGDGVGKRHEPGGGRP